MTTRKPLTGRNSRFEDLAPFVAERARAAIAQCHEEGYQIALFEGYRSPQRQDELYALGRTLPGKKVTNCKAWQSWHQYSVGLDVAYLYDGKRWSWEGDFDKPAAIFEDHGFEWLFPYEKCHFQITCGLSIKEAREYETLTELWDVIHARLLRNSGKDHG